MAWLDETYVVNAIGQVQAYRLGLVTTSSGAYAATARLTQYEAEARGVVSSVLVFAGYSPPVTVLITDTAGGMLLRLTCAVMLRAVYQMATGITLPDATATMIGIAQGELQAVYDKRLPVPGLTPASIAAIGGVQFSPPCGTPFRSLRGSSY